jgi:hypothetical protein
VCERESFFGYFHSLTHSFFNTFIISHVLEIVDVVVVVDVIVVVVIVEEDMCSSGTSEKEKLFAVTKRYIMFPVYLYFSRISKRFAASRPSTDFFSSSRSSVSFSRNL